MAIWTLNSRRCVGISLGTISPGLCVRAPMYVRSCTSYTHSGLKSLRNALRSPLCINSTTIILCHHTQTRDKNPKVDFDVGRLTGSVVVTTPCRVRMLGCLNWAMMAASWRNLTVLAESVRVFTATSITPLSEVHSPLLTLPKFPEPSVSISLHTKT